MTLSELSLNAAGVGFVVSLPEEPARLLRQLYAAFPGIAEKRDSRDNRNDRDKSPVPKVPSVPHVPSPHWRLSWQGNECHIAGLTHPVVVPGPHLIPAITTILLGKLLERSRPDFLFLHGNGLVHRQSGGVLLLLGASGSGKSTLSALLQEGDWELLAEDLLIVDPAERQVHPFPRAATVRGGDEGLAWAGLGEESEAKRLRPASGKVERAGSLEGARVVLLGSPTAAAGESSDGKLCHWITTAPAALLRDLGELVAGPVAVIQGRDFPAVVTGPLSAEQEAAFHGVLASHGALLLRSVAAHKATAPRLRNFPERPILATLAAGEALPELPAHAIRFGGPRPPAHRTLMTMARAFSQARFLRFASGGTPEQAAACLAQGLADAEVSAGG